MLAPAKIVSIHPYFKVKHGNLGRAKMLLPEFLARTSNETGNLFYDFTINGDVIFCREAYVGAEGLLRHLENVEPVLKEFLMLVDIIRVEVHGSAEELGKLREPMAALKPEWFQFECGVTK